ncbi:trypsin-like serine protease [Actinoplanes sp. M2I2]|uniref:trypsin-like serine protease n=1 Tax=Actinoplanes sp. M2I2 TaxID=1734444 RepID=UPI0020218C2E|nr:trypsin-like serine protease [Actinoplanes sp. M2I2]
MRPIHTVRLVVAALAATAGVTAIAGPAQAIVGDAPVVSSAANPYAFVGRSATRFDDGRSSLCTVELIDPQIAITARHCTTGKDYTARTEIVFGGTRIEGNAALPAGPRYRVSQVHRNEDADIALLKLTRRVDGISPAALASTAFGNSVQKNRIVTVVGWGNVDTKGTGTTVLRQASHGIQARNDNTFIGKRLSNAPVPNFSTVPGYYRPGDGGFVRTGRYAISGDSGGAMLAYDGNRPVLVGIFTTFFPKKFGPVGGKVTQNYFTNIGATGKFGLQDWMSRHLSQLRSAR